MYVDHNTKEKKTIAIDSSLLNKLKDLSSREYKSEKIEITILQAGKVLLKLAIQKKLLLDYLENENSGNKSGYNFYLLFKIRVQKFSNIHENITKILAKIPIDTITNIKYKNIYKSASFSLYIKNKKINSMSHLDNNIEILMIYPNKNTKILSISKEILLQCLRDNNYLTSFADKILKKAEPYPYQEDIVKFPDADDSDDDNVIGITGSC